MDQMQRTKRFGIYVILCACLFRLAGNLDAVMLWLADEQNLPFLIYLETGRNVRFSASSPVFSPHFRESPGPWLPEPEKPRFQPDDAQSIAMDYDCDRRPDIAALLAAPLDWDLTQGGPAVLILHTHATESYTKAGEDYEETARYRTLDAEHNMLSIGTAVAGILEQAGIGVVHDRTLHDYPSYNGSYVHARRAIEEALAEYPSIRLILDLHRDASETGGSQLRTTAVVNGSTSAQLMFVVGTDVSRPAHKNWEENLSLALKFQAVLEAQSPGLMRPVNLRGQRFNQDLSAGALLVEVGAAGNTHSEALRAAEALAAAVIRLAKGSAQ